MELSSVKKSEAKKLGVSVQELVLADLLSIGYSDNDAYAIAYPEDQQLNFSMQQANRKKIMSRVAFMELREKRKISNANILEFSGDTADIDLIDTETTAKEILKIAKRMPDGSKERGEMFMKYADLTRKNDAATEEAMDAIQFYFPIKCNQCPLFDAYNTFVRQKGGREIRPVEMEAIIAAAAQIMEKARKKAGN
jgi:hypothetical protein